MARPSNTAERRAQIAAALISVMAKKGYDGASVADVAAHAGLAPGLVHYHFKNKQEILVSALRGVVARHEERLAARVAAAGPHPARRLEAFVDFHLGLGADADPEALACWILLSGEALRQPAVRRELRRSLESFAATLAHIVGDGVDAGAFRCDDPAAASAALLATIQGYFLLAATARELIPRGSAAASAKHMAEGLLRPSKPFENRRRR